MTAGDGAHGLDGDEPLEELPFRLRVEADEHGPGLALGLVVMDEEADRLAVVAGPPAQEGLAHDGGQEDLIAHPAGQDDHPVVLLLEELPFDVADHGIPFKVWKMA